MIDNLCVYGTLYKMSRVSVVIRSNDERGTTNVIYIVQSGNIDVSCILIDG